MELIGARLNQARLTANLALQDIAVTTGMGVFKLVTAQQSPDIYQPSWGNMVYVFELAD